ncbi:MAG: glycoside hydrolase family 15 protein [Pseudonocardiaceae bacterium]
MPARVYAKNQTRFDLTRPEGVAQPRSTFLAAMQRNMATSGYVIAWVPSEHGYNGGATKYSEPGCLIASPSYDAEQKAVHGAPLNQDYVYNWTRDAALAAIELSFDEPPPGATESQRMIDYVSFAKLCQDNAAADPKVAKGDIGHATFYVDGTPWDKRGPQYDGPALQSLAIMQCFGQLSAQSQNDAKTVIEKNVQHIVDKKDDPSQNLWEELAGMSFFTRAVQLRCLKEAKAKQAEIGLNLPDIDAATTALAGALDSHWSDEKGLYVSVKDPDDNPGIDIKAYDPNIDIVMASIYGAVPCTGVKLLATAAQVRDQWSDHGATNGNGNPLGADVVYPINVQDAPDRGPLMGRYPGDTYDGDTDEKNKSTGHPWALCTANYAAFYYCVASALKCGPLKFPLQADGIAAATVVKAEEFFSKLGINPAAGHEANAADVLRDAGDKMLDSVVYHSNHLELSEQFDKSTGFEKSVENLTWSYSAFLNALRARSDSIACNGSAT